MRIADINGLQMDVVRCWIYLLTFTLYCSTTQQSSTTYLSIPSKSTFAPNIDNFTKQGDIDELIRTSDEQTTNETEQQELKQQHQQKHKEQQEHQPKQQDKRLQLPQKQFDKNVQQLKLEQNQQPQQHQQKQHQQQQQQQQENNEKLEIDGRTEKRQDNPQQKHGKQKREDKNKREQPEQQEKHEQQKQHEQQEQHDVMKTQQDLKKDSDSDANSQGERGKDAECPDPARPSYGQSDLPPSTYSPMVGIQTALVLIGLVVFFLIHIHCTQIIESFERCVTGQPYPSSSPGSTTYDDDDDDCSNLTDSDRKWISDNKHTHRDDARHSGSALRKERKCGDVIINISPATSDGELSSSSELRVCLSSLHDNDDIRSSKSENAVYRQYDRLGSHKPAVRSNSYH